MHASINLLSQLRLKKMLWVSIHPAINQQETLERAMVLSCRYIRGCPYQNPSARLLWIIHFDTQPFLSSLQSTKYLFSSYQAPVPFLQQA